MPKNGTTIDNLFRAGSTEAVQIGSSFVTKDATASPQSSPLAYTNATTLIVVPDNAVEIILAPSTDIRVSELANMASYYVIPAGQAEAIGVSKQTNVYVTRDTVNGTLNFRFTIV